MVVLDHFEYCILVILSAKINLSDFKESYFFIEQVLLEF